MSPRLNGFLRRVEDRGLIWFLLSFLSSAVVALLASDSFLIKIDYSRSDCNFMGSDKRKRP